ncbi:glutathione S-transferase family protein, partial [Rhizobiaceae sp. 2RAB30]
MKLFDGGKAPNPRRVRIFLAEKGIEVPLVPIDMNALGHREETVASRNPLRRLPVLELDDGTIITESIAICRYFEELHPEPALFGRGALGKAVVEMWQRRMELNLMMPVAQAFRHIHPAMKEWEVPQFPDWGEANKPKALEFLRLLDAELAQREFIAGDGYSVADITG